MKIKIITVGKERAEEYQNLINDYYTRINKYINFEIIYLDNSKIINNIEEYKRDEAKSILSKLNKDDYIILLDERGQTISTTQHTELINQKMNNSENIIYIIGGVYGVDNSISEMSNKTIKLSDFVLPHKIARLIITEQIYRSFTIINNTKYHHI